MKWKYFRMLIISGERAVCSDPDGMIEERRKHVMIDAELLSTWSLNNMIKCKSKPRLSRDCYRISFWSTTLAAIAYILSYQYIIFIRSNHTLHMLHSTDWSWDKYHDKLLNIWSRISAKVKPSPCIIWDSPPR